MSKIIFNAAAKCDKAGRSQNQDNYWLCTDLAVPGKSTDGVNNDADVALGQKGAIFVVADGMGGMNAGEKASEIVVKSIEYRFSSIPANVLLNDASILQYISDSIKFADQQVKEYAKTHPEAEGLGSTIVLLWLYNNKAYCGWCGDSRIYRFNPNNKIVRLSHDHSYVQSLVDEGKIDPSEAFDHPDGNIINRSLGDSGAVANPETKVYDVFERDVFLLCSDGLCGLLQDKEIEDIIATHSSSSKDALKALWEAGTKAGWSDNATIELVNIISGGCIAKGIPQGYPEVKPPVKKAKPVAAATAKAPVVKESSGSKKAIIIALAVAVLAAIGLLCYTLIPRGSKSHSSSNNEYNVEVQEGTDGQTDNDQQPASSGNNQNSQQSQKPNGQQSQQPGNQQQQQQPADQNNQQQQQNNDSKTPSADYMKQLDNTRKDYDGVSKLWGTVKAEESIPDEASKQHLLNFAKNALHLSDPNNADYKKLSDRQQAELVKWRSLANEITKNISKYPVSSAQKPQKPQKPKLPQTPGKPDVEVESNHPGPSVSV